MSTTMFTKTDLTFLHQTKQKFLRKLIAILRENNANYDHFCCRVKTNSSIANKMQNKGKDPSPYIATDILTDIIGIRIVTQYVSDIYDIINIIRKHYSIKEECDYVAKPKPSGYRSYHIVIPVSVDITQFPYTDTLNIEIQIRTMGMDFWASLEHSLMYDKSKQSDFNPTGGNTTLVHHELLNYAESIFSIDMRLQALKHLTEKNP